MYVSSVPNLQGQYCFAQKDVKGVPFAGFTIWKGLGILLVEVYL